jgi:hypothetical protein
MGRVKLFLICISVQVKDNRISISRTLCYSTLEDGETRRTKKKCGSTMPVTREEGSVQEAQGQEGCDASPQETLPGVGAGRRGGVVCGSRRRRVGGDHSFDRGQRRIHDVLGFEHRCRPCRWRQRPRGGNVDQSARLCWQDRVAQVQAHVAAWAPCSS